LRPQFCLRWGLLFPLGLGFLSLSLLRVFPLDLSSCFLRSLLLLPLLSPAFGERWTKPGAVGASAIANKSGTQSGNPATPLVSLPGQILLQYRSRAPQSSDFPLQPHHRFGQYTHLCPRFTKVRPMRGHFRSAPNA